MLLPPPDASSPLLKEPCRPREELPSRCFSESSGAGTLWHAPIGPRWSDGCLPGRSLHLLKQRLAFPGVACLCFGVDPFGRSPQQGSHRAFSLCRSRYDTRGEAHLNWGPYVTIHSDRVQLGHGETTMYGPAAASRLGLARSLSVHQHILDILLSWAGRHCESGSSWPSPRPSSSSAGRWAPALARYSGDNLHKTVP
jgi:hypothetical protein